MEDIKHTVASALKPFTKICRLGKVKEVVSYSKDGVHEIPVPVFVKIKYSKRDRDREGFALSITGVVGPRPHGDAAGNSGQIDSSLVGRTFTEYAPGWDASLVARFLEVWDRYHLNDLTAGTPKQEALIRNKKAEINKIDNSYRESSHAYASKQGYESCYDMFCAWLKEADLLIDPSVKDRHGNDYRYGTEWLYEEVPTDVLLFLKNLPDTDMTPNWV